MPAGTDERLGLAEVLIGLSLVADLGTGLDPGEAARACLLAMRLADEVGAPDRTDVFYTTLLQHLGCTAYAREAAARLGGDEIRRGGWASATASRAALRKSSSNPTAAAARMARVATTSRSALAWRRSARSPRSSTASAVPELAVAKVRRRAGVSLDPEIADCFCHHAGALLGELAAADVVSAVLAAEPRPVAGVRGERVDGICAAFADVIDLKSPYFHGHAAQTAHLAERAAAALGADTTRLRRASLLHGLGRAAIPKPRPHRVALDLDAAADLTGDCRAGLRDLDAVEAVLAAAGARERARTPRTRPAGLTERQVEVLRLVARGCRTPRSRRPHPLAPHGRAPREGRLRRPLRRARPEGALPVDAARVSAAGHVRGRMSGERRPAYGRFRCTSRGGRGAAPRPPRRPAVRPRSCRSPRP